MKKRYKGDIYDHSIKSSDQQILNLAHEDAEIQWLNHEISISNYLIFHNELCTLWENGKLNPSRIQSKWVYWFSYHVTNLFSINSRFIPPSQMPSFD